MDTSVLAPWRDLAIVLLVLEAAVMIAAPGIALFFALKGMRALNRWIRKPLLQAQVWALRIQHAAIRGSSAVASVPITLAMNATQASTTARGLLNYLWRRPTR